MLIKQKMKKKVIVVGLKQQIVLLDRSQKSKRTLEMEKLRNLNLRQNFVSQLTWDLLLRFCIVFLDLIKATSCNSSSILNNLHPRCSSLVASFLQLQLNSCLLSFLVSLKWALSYSFLWETLYLELLINQYHNSIKEFQKVKLHGSLVHGSQVDNYKLPYFRVEHLKSMLMMCLNSLKCNQEECLT